MITIKELLKPSRIVPFITITSGAVFIAVGSLGFIHLSLTEGVIISLLGLLAVDALVERVNVLERIERTLGNDSRSQPLRKRDRIPTPERFAHQASSIHVLAVSGISIARQYQNFYTQKLREGCHIEFLLLKPDSTLLEIWKKQNLGSSATEAHINSTLQVLRSLATGGIGECRCEVRLLNMFTPFSIVGVDFGKAAAKLLVEFHGYKTAPDQRAHIEISKEDHPYWFDFYLGQYKAAWDDSEPVNWNSDSKSS